MGTGMFEIHADLRQFEVRRDVAGMQQAAESEPRGVRRLSVPARRAVVSVAAAILAVLRLGH